MNPLPLLSSIKSLFGNTQENEPTERFYERKGASVGKKLQRIARIEFDKATKDDIMTLGTTPIVAPVKARRPLVREWWKSYQTREAKKAANVVTVYVFHYHLRLLFPKES